MFRHLFIVGVISGGSNTADKMKGKRRRPRKPFFKGVGKKYKVRKTKEDKD